MYNRGNLLIFYNMCDNKINITRLIGDLDMGKNKELIVKENNISEDEYNYFQNLHQTHGSQILLRTKNLFDDYIIQEGGKELKKNIEKPLNKVNDALEEKDQPSKIKMINGIKLEIMKAITKILTKKIKKEKKRKKLIKKINKKINKIINKKIKQVNKQKKFKYELPFYKPLNVYP
jgi:hypothetical protein